MVKFNHLGLPVLDCQASRDWYVKNFGFVVEFEDLARRIVAIKDDADFTIFMSEPQGPVVGVKCSLTLQVDDADSKYSELKRRGVAFEDSPGKYFWGYGAELRDPTVTW